MGTSVQKTLNVGFLLITVALSLLLFTGAASAQEEGDFSYTAERGDNLTLLVRESVEALAENDGVQLSDGQLIAAETLIVNEIGATQLNVGQEVNIARGIVQSGLNQSTELSDAEIARWAAFGPITRSSERPEPEAAEESVEEEQVEEPEQTEEPVEQTGQPEVEEQEESVEEQPAEEQEAETEENTNEPTPEDEQPVEAEEPVGLTVDGEAPATADVLESAIGSTGEANGDENTVDGEDSDSGTAPWYWWVIGGTALGAMWYILGGGSKKTAPAKKNAKKQNAKTKKANRK